MHNFLMPLHWQLNLNISCGGDKLIKPQQGPFIHLYKVANPGGLVVISKDKIYGRTMMASTD
jgi:hypothetical protein